MFQFLSDKKSVLYFSNIPFGVSPFKKGSMKANSSSVWVMTAVCDVAGKTARREAGSGLPVSP
jgi:hypothetical protein